MSIKNRPHAHERKPKTVRPSFAINYRQALALRKAIDAYLDACERAPVDGGISLSDAAAVSVEEADLMMQMRSIINVLSGE